MSIPLDYAARRPPHRQGFSFVTWAMLIALFEHLLVFGLYAATLDGGVLAKQCAAVAVCFWALVLLMLARRWRNPTKLDLAFIAFGYPVMLFPCIYLVRGGL